ncbi:hypothetical protein FACHB389_25370 [Nostoc calcicola FACHB-389]|nr:hypothetical protein FACHB389_25370 [Nostoc calcicola FACHB-389]
MHPNIIKSELHELLLRLPKTPNSPKIGKFGILKLFRLGVKRWGDGKMGREFHPTPATFPMRHTSLRKVAPEA